MSATTCAALLVKWQHLNSARYGPAHVPPDIGNRLCEIERQMTATPALTLRDALAKATLLAHWEHEGIIPVEEADHLAASLRNDLERLARGGTS